MRGLVVLVLQWLEDTIEGKTGPSLNFLYMGRGIKTIHDHTLHYIHVTFYLSYRINLLPTAPRLLLKTTADWPTVFKKKQPEYNFRSFIAGIVQDACSNQPGFGASSPCIPLFARTNSW